MDEVRERESEVIETFQSEGMLTEAAFLEQGTTACTSSISWKLKTYAKFTSRSVNQRMISIRNRKRSWTMFWKVPGSWSRKLRTALLYGQSRPGVSADNTSEEQDFNRAKHFKMEPTGGCQQLLTCNNTL